MLHPKTSLTSQVLPAEFGVVLTVLSGLIIDAYMLRSDGLRLLARLKPCTETILRFKEPGTDGDSTWLPSRFIVGRDNTTGVFVGLEFFAILFVSGARSMVGIKSKSEVLSVSN
jgi:hypothetical protein